LRRALKRGHRSISILTPFVLPVKVFLFSDVFTYLLLIQSHCANIVASDPESFPIPMALHSRWRRMAALTFQKSSGIRDTVLGQYTYACMDMVRQSVPLYDFTITFSSTISPDNISKSAPELSIYNLPSIVKYPNDVLFAFPFYV